MTAVTLDVFISCCWQHPDKISATQKTTYCVCTCDSQLPCPFEMQKQRVSFAVGRAVPGAPLRSAGAAAALPARGPGPGLCKEPSYARNADFPLRNRPPLSEPSVLVPARIYINGGESGAGGLGASLAPSAPTLRCGGSFHSRFAEVPPPPLPAGHFLPLK